MRSNSRSSVLSVSSVVFGFEIKNRKSTILWFILLKSKFKTQ